MPKNKPNTKANCLNCGKEFFYYLAPSHKNNPRRLQKFCSYKCSSERKRPSRKKEKACEICGKKMMVFPYCFRRKRFCSKACKNKSESIRPHNSNAVTLICKICNSPFTVLPSQSQKRKCCSRKCSSQYRSTYPGKIWTVIECRHCHKKYKIRTYRLPDSANHFCSRQCKVDEWIEQHKASHIILHCAICGKEYVRSIFFVTRRKSSVCSRKCLDALNSLIKRGAGNPNWVGGTTGWYGPNWMAQKRLARKRDQCKCVVCDAQGHLDVHHIIPFRMFGYILGGNENYLQANALSNLVTLCRKHHKRAEKHPEEFLDIFASATAITSASN